MKAHLSLFSILNLSVLVIVLLLHLPFIHADPDSKLCCSRDAFNAEGLNSFQIRNYINQGYFSWYEGDNLVKMPFFNLLLFFSLKIFGTHLIVARLTVLVSILICLIAAVRLANWKIFIPVLLTTTLLQYHVFLYSHLVMSEMIGVVFVVLSIAWLVKSIQSENKRSRNIILASCFSFLAYFLKIQFVYVVVLVPASLLTLRIFKMSSIRWKDCLTGLLISAFFVVLYLLLWYYPHRDFINYVLQYEGSDKIPAWHQALSNANWNFRNVFLSPETGIYIITSIFLIVVGLVQMFRTKNGLFKSSYIIGFIWLLLELHRLAFSYFPPRYQVSLYFAFGFLASLVISENLFQRQSSRIEKSLAIIAMALMLIPNTTDYLNTYSRRLFTIWDMNQYMEKRIINPDRTVLGTWGTAITWEAKTRSAPVWNNFLNDDNTLEMFHPQSIVTEPDEAESNGAYKAQQIDIDAITDSSRTWKISYWTVTVRWVH